MYKTEGVDAIVSITDLRQKTGDLLETIRGDAQFVGIQRNNEPVAVLLSWDTYRRVKQALDTNE